PARYDSSRFPGKPLADILGRPMFWHVHHRAQQCAALDTVVLATDDDRIFSKARDLGVPAVMTRKDHPSGTDRTLEAAERLGAADDAVVVNIQGDEPLLEPGMITELTSPFRDPEARVATLARPISAAEAESPDIVKVVLGEGGKALYFSRAPIPYPRDQGRGAYYGHVGLYAFRMEALRRFAALGPGRLERIEKLEQLRLLENDIPIHVVETTRVSIGVDRPEDLDAVRELLEKQGFRAPNS
ncbi:MAG: 3-deoxy-manno-octulosonate cytidylyltransferase, partial [Desulfobacterales bacterium]|nr:3-deoxy-manno-octulosonate cytidylyltransferase [Desulfobacterales bacterium]